MEEDWVIEAKKQMRRLQDRLSGSTWRGKLIDTMSDREFMRFIGEFVETQTAEIERALMVTRKELL